MSDGQVLNTQSLEYWNSQNNKKSINISNHISPCFYLDHFYLFGLLNIYVENGTLDGVGQKVKNTVKSLI